MIMIICPGYCGGPPAMIGLDRRPAAAGRRPRVGFDMIQNHVDLVSRISRT